MSARDYSWVQQHAENSEKLQGESLYKSLHEAQRWKPATLVEVITHLVAVLEKVEAQNRWQAPAEDVIESVLKERKF